MSEAAPAKFVLGQRLYVRFYLALLASLAITALLFGIAHWHFDPAQVDTNLDTIAELATEVLPPATAPAEVQRLGLRKWSRKLNADLALYAADLTLIARVGHALPPLKPNQKGAVWLRGNPSVFVLKLRDGRWLQGQRRHGHRAVVGLVVLLVLIALTVGVAAFPVVRRLTRRLEKLQRSVEAWGQGQLSARVDVEGRDEVAHLASSFNDSAARIEALVAAQKSLLANASHELRSPLARIRMAVELMQDTATPAMRDELKRNVAELDQLIDEVLLASRLDAIGTTGPRPEEVDLTGILAEECARVDATLVAGAVSMRGDARLMRRLVRNLLENALRHGAGTAVAARLEDGNEATLELSICDSGPGIPESERERVFEPFYRVPGASETAGGVGLGLSLVRQIARHHGGDVQCLANPGGGCCFKVTLPLD
ncbi:MAG: ATP-binding protein [Pseudomonadota bacterium]